MHMFEHYRTYGWVRQASEIFPEGRTCEDNLQVLQMGCCFPTAAGEEGALRPAPNADRTALSRMFRVIPVSEMRKSMNCRGCFDYEH